MPAFQLDADHVFRVADFERLPWLEHGFGTRHTRHWPPLDRLVRVHQIHSDIVLDVEEMTGGGAPDGDGLISTRPGVLVGVRTADCQPILVVDEKQRVVAAVHAGWRGTVSEIVAKAVERLKLEYGSRPRDLLAAIGPSIGLCCYEVGPEVAQRFQKFFPERGDLNAQAHIDLTEANRRQLLNAGLSPGRVFTGAPCTCCNPDFHSFRRDKSKGRMYSVVGIRP